MRSNYNFSKGVRGKYAKKFHQGTNLVALEPDVQRAFPNSGAVNKALRDLIKLAKNQRALPFYRASSN
jgi:hypothetical protein